MRLVRLQLVDCMSRAAGGLLGLLKENENGLATTDEKEILSPGIIDLNREDEIQAVSG